MCVPAVPITELPARLGYPGPVPYPEASLTKSLTAWQMEVDDAPILRYLYRSARPNRHLEFGTWLGTGTLYCLEECDATVWTVNVLEGETLPDGSWAYSTNVARPPRRSFLQRWLRPAPVCPRIPEWARIRTDSLETIGYQTDSFGFIGRHYLEKGLGARVCQVYADSREWDIRHFPAGFFDTVLIDGGHAIDVVTNDTRKACTLVRSGGLVVWHDFCPDPDVLARCPSTRGVLEAIEKEHGMLRETFADLFWIKPSWILVGVKK